MRTRISQDGYRTFGLIPARAGSKGVPNKNLRVLGSQTLVERAVTTALQIKAINQLWVSSDSQQILDIASRLGASPHLRSSASSSDDATAAQVIKEFIVDVKANPRDIIMYLQPTSPFRTQRNIEDSLDLFFEEGCCPLVSVRSMTQHPAKALRFLPNGKVTPAGLDVQPNSNRQTLPDYLYPNGAIYIFYVADFLDSEEVPLEGSVPYFMSELESMDIDSESDLLICERLANEF